MGAASLDLEAELHAHAQQLITLAQDHDFGFAVLLVTTEGRLLAASNLAPAQREQAAHAWATGAEGSQHGPGGKA